MDEVIQRFRAQGVRYLLIGGQAVRLAGLPRFSLDWDFFIPPRDADNLRRIEAALGDELDYPLATLGVRGQNVIQTYQTRWGVIQFHLGAPGLPPFDEAARRAAVHHTENGTPVLCLGLADLLASKVRAGRPQDLQDADFLKRLQSQTAQAGKPDKP
ncbi:MAG: nucleotidyl transferase AbiEii/AbiGii toxin family protein [Kiritimatiellaeota bacterium]|nr:nucleotidyl transferase AbiEii/AbiGii toxin family protein [Kiritimatiellota bacterium]